MATSPPAPEIPAAANSRPIPRPSGMRQRSLPIFVPRTDLLNATDNGLSKLSFKLFSSRKRRVSVEANPYGRSDSVFYAPFRSITADRSASTPTSTEFLTVPPTADTPDLVAQHHDFELAFIGLNVPPQDAGASNNNELLLFSVSKDSEGSLSDLSSPSMSTNALDMNAMAAVDIPPNELTQPSVRFSKPIKSYPTQSNFGILPSDVPYIHYDPNIDGRNDGATPNTFLPISDSKSIFFQHCGASGSPKIPVVPIRFTVMEIDKVTSAHANAIGQIDKINGHMKQATVATPFAHVISSAVEVANSLGKKGLKRYANPDHIISKDIEFKLVQNVPGVDGPSDESDGERRSNIPVYSGNYLRYGYYFFLQGKVDARLYAQTDTSSQNVPLLMRRIGLTSGVDTPLSQGEFFPLTGVSYVVVKVSPGCTPGRGQRNKLEVEEHRERLENILNIGTALGMLASMK